MTTPLPSPPISLSPPSAGERLARCTTPPALSSPPTCCITITSFIGCPTIQTLRTRLHQALVDRGMTIPSTEHAHLARGRTCLLRALDLEEAVPEIAPMTVGEVNTRVTELAESLHERDTQDLYALLEDAQDGRTRISQRVAMDSQRVDLLMGDRMTLQETRPIPGTSGKYKLQSSLIQTQYQVFETVSRMQQADRCSAIDVTDSRRQELSVGDLSSDEWT
ncbi:hypothetical protein Tco_1122947 [Tanacetum coccineum]|uniref:Uncharacterized protein n=1 Tax=Tanacetum coccineum TaxID=301880 RepID=A0ABQ5J1Y5_9ASTR